MPVSYYRTAPPEMSSRRNLARYTKPIIDSPPPLGTDTHLLLCVRRNLTCDRTRIHRNLFVAMLIYVSIQLTVHVDKMIVQMFYGHGRSMSRLYFRPAYITV